MRACSDQCPLTAACVQWPLISAVDAVAVVVTLPGRQDALTTATAELVGQTHVVSAHLDVLVRAVLAV